AVSLLASFCRLEGFAKFLGNCSGNRTAANGKTARENSSRLDKENIGCARPDIHEQRAVVNVRVAIAKCIVECHRRHIDSGSKQPTFFHSVVNSIEQIVLDRDQDYLNLLVQPASDHLIIPNHVVDRKAYALLPPERDALPHLSVCTR